MNHKDKNDVPNFTTLEELTRNYIAALDKVMLSHSTLNPQALAPYINNLYTLAGFGREAQALINLYLNGDQYNKEQK